MKFIREKEIKNLLNEDLVKHIKSIAELLSNEEGVDSVELDSCQDLNGEEIVYNGTVIGIYSVTPEGLKYNDMTGNIIGTISFRDATSLSTNLLIEIVNNYQGTIINEIL